FEPVRKRFSSVKISKVRGKIFTIVVTRVDSALNHNVSRLQEVAMNQDQALTNILKLLIKNLSLF
ncbi:hypothetical protein, partial [Flavobacterium psychrophilum]|uniref:hypothetical protein n=2 Tax=Flavobacterium psychrophilum TaxID=96345 RepID=UPI001D089B65